MRRDELQRPERTPSDRAREIMKRIGMDSTRRDWDFFACDIDLTVDFVIVQTGQTKNIPLAVSEAALTGIERDTLVWNGDIKTGASAILPQPFSALNYGDLSIGLGRDAAEEISDLSLTYIAVTTPYKGTSETIYQYTGNESTRPAILLKPWFFGIIGQKTSESERELSEQMRNRLFFQVTAERMRQDLERLKGYKGGYYDPILWTDVKATLAYLSGREESQRIKLAQEARMI